MTGIEKELKRGFSLKKLTTMSVGGPADYFVEAKTEDRLKEAIGFAKKKRLKWAVVGEGSNLIPEDVGFRGLVIKNAIKGFERRANRVTVGAGNNLLKLIFKLNKLGLSGLEKMAGIPGSVGGAVYGSVGAYGQEIKDRVVSVRFYNANTGRTRTYSKKQCGFVYRGSVFKKHKNWIIVSVTLRMSRGKPAKLTNISKDIVELREYKYRPGLRCPGSFFKNIKLEEIKPQSTRSQLLRQIPEDKVMFGKIPVGYLLEEVGAKGMGQGRVRVAGHHANLVYNPGGAMASDIKKLAQKLKKLVKTKFGVKIEEEVQYLD